MAVILSVTKLYAIILYRTQVVSDELTEAGKTYTVSQLTLSDYFNAKQADIVINSDVLTDTGEPGYEFLTQEALDQLIQIMSQYDVIGSGEAFLTNLTPEHQEQLALAWNDTILQTGQAIWFENTIS